MEIFFLDINDSVFDFYFYLLFKFVILEGFGKFMLNFGYLGFRYILV